MLIRDMALGLGSEKDDEGRDEDGGEQALDQLQLDEAEVEDDDEVVRGLDLGELDASGGTSHPAICVSSSRRLHTLSAGRRPSAPSVCVSRSSASAEGSGQNTILTYSSMFM